MFERSSAEVASTLQLAIAHQDDLVLNVGAYVIANPNASQADVVHWSEAADHMDRFPEVLGFGFVVIVPAAELPAFIESAVADPAGSSAADGSFEITPPGDRELYCLAKYGVVRSVPLTSAGFDFCAADGAGSRRCGGRGTRERAPTQPIETSFGKLLGVNVPVYRDGADPTTVEGRREAFVGWVGTVSVPRSF